MRSQLRRYLSEDVRRWLLSHEDGAKRLAAAGIPSRSLIEVRQERCTEKFLFMYRDAIEKTTGLDVEKICVRAAKRELWGNTDKLPAVISRADAARELRRVAPGRLTELEHVLRFGGGQKRFEDYLADTGKWGMERLLKVLTAVAQSADPETPKTHSERIADSLVAMMSSVANIADAGIDPEQVPSGAKLQVASSAARVLQKLGITQDAVRELRASRSLTAAGADAIRTVLDNFKP